MPGSLLLIAVVWIVLLTPLVLFNRRPVRQTSEALTETRLVHSGGTELRGKRKLRPSPALYTADDRDEELELVDAEPEYVLLDDEGNGMEQSAPGKSVAVSGHTKRSAEIAEAKAEGTEVVDAEVVDGELVEDETEAGAGEVEADSDNATDVEPGAVAPATSSEANADAKTAGKDEAETEEAEAGAGAADIQPDATAETGLALKVDAKSYKSQDETDTGEFEPVAEEDVITALQRKKRDKGSVKPSPKQKSTEVSTAEKPGAEKTAANPTEVPAGVFRGVDYDDSRGREDHVRELATAGTARPAEKLYDSMELSEDDMNYIASRRGRGVFDPVASAEANRRRQQRRKHVLMGLVAVLVLSLGLALWNGGAMWLAPTVMTMLTVFYLVALRKNAIEEAKLRRRRLARMRRARLGVHNTEDHELGVIPERLMRPGAVIIEPDEADAELQNLAVVDSRDFFRNEDEDHFSYDEHHIRAV